MFIMTILCCAKHERKNELLFAVGFFTANVRLIDRYIGLSREINLNVTDLFSCF